LESSVTFFTLVPGARRSSKRETCGTADDADDLGLDAEMAEGLDQLAADRFVVAGGPGPLSPLPFSSTLPGGGL
jgi:hypothetical protein